VWNLVDPGSAASERYVVLQFRGLGASSAVKVTSLDEQRGSSLAAYRAMGSPRYPTAAQLRALNRSAELPQAQSMQLAQDGSITLTIPANGLVLVESR